MSALTNSPDQLAPITDPFDAPEVVTTLSDVKPQRVDWLWPGRLPLGKLVESRRADRVQRDREHLRRAATVRYWTGVALGWQEVA